MAVLGSLHGVSWCPQTATSARARRAVRSAAATRRARSPARAAPGTACRPTAPPVAPSTVPLLALSCIPLTSSADSRLKMYIVGAEPLRTEVG